MMHFSPLFKTSPLFSRNFQTLKKMSKILPFPKKFLDFHPQKSLTTFFIVILDFSHRHFEFSLCFTTYPPCFTKIIIFPTTLTNPPCFRQFHILYVYFVSPLL